MRGRTEAGREREKEGGKTKREREEGRKEVGGRKVKSEGGGKGEEGR